MFFYLHILIFYIFYSKKITLLIIVVTLATDIVSIKSFSNKIIMAKNKIYIVNIIQTLEFY